MPITDVVDVFCIPILNMLMWHLRPYVDLTKSEYMKTLESNIIEK